MESSVAEHWHGLTESRSNRFPEFLFCVAGKSITVLQQQVDGDADHSVVCDPLPRPAPGAIQPAGQPCQIIGLVEPYSELLAFQL